MMINPISYIKRKKRQSTNFAFEFSKHIFPISSDYRLLKDLKGKHSGKRCFIIGNGPSLNDLDLSLLKDEITFGVNAIYTNFQKMGFYPTYYVVEDMLVAEDRAEEINAYTESIKFFPNYVKHCIRRVGNQAYFNFVQSFDALGYPAFSQDFSHRVYFGGTVSYVCLQLAYHMGFDEVYLIGFDHSYSIPEQAIREGNVITSTTEDPNHFNSEYFGKGKRWHNPMLDRMEKSYIVARRMYEAENRTIINASSGGKLEVFDRIEFLSLFTR
jgi:hypothetical protein